MKKIYAALTVFLTVLLAGFISGKSGFDLSHDVPAFLQELCQSAEGIVKAICKAFCNLGNGEQGTNCVDCVDRK